MKIKYFLGEIVENGVDIDNRRIRFVVSSDKIDRHGDIVEAAAVEKAIKEFGKNPVFLAAHMHRSNDAKPTVIGSWDISSFKQTKGRSEMDAVFASTALAEEYWQLYKDKHMRAVSIGFRVLDSKTEKKDGHTIYIFTKIELYEISAVAVGANRQALAKKLKDAGELDETDIYIQQAVELALKDAQCWFNEVLNEIKSDIENVKVLTLDAACNNSSNRDRTAEVLLGEEPEASGDDAEKNYAEKVFSNLRSS